MDTEEYTEIEEATFLASRIRLIKEIAEETIEKLNYIKGLFHKANEDFYKPPANWCDFFLADIQEDIDCIQYEAQEALKDHFLEIPKPQVRYDKKIVPRAIQQS